MNYIKEINAFYNHIEQNPLSASAVTLWHALMHINNKSMWAESFTVAAPVLRLKSGLKDSSFKRARTELKEKGYIDYQSRERNQAPVYRMTALSLGMDHSTGYVADQDMDGVADQEADRVVDHRTDPLIKQKKLNKTKRNDITAAADAFVFYQENFGAISPFLSDTLLNWVNDMGEDLVLDAMKRALEQGKGNWSYVKGILQAWVNTGITSVEAAKAEKIEFRRKQKPPYVDGTEEVVPDWFKEQKRKEMLKREQEKVERVPHDSAVDQAEVQRLLAAYRSGSGVCGVV